MQHLQGSCTYQAHRPKQLKNPWVFLFACKSKKNYHRYDTTTNTNFWTLVPQPCGPCWQLVACFQPPASWTAHSITPLISSQQNTLTLTTTALALHVPAHYSVPTAIPAIKEGLCCISLPADSLKQELCTRNVSFRLCPKWWMWNS